MNWICKVCGADLTKVPWEVDHVHPRSKGGTDNPENLQILCRTCNRSKRAKTMKQWRPWLIKDGIPILSWEEIGGQVREQKHPLIGLRRRPKSFRAKSWRRQQPRYDLD